MPFFEVEVRRDTVKIQRKYISIQADTAEEASKLVLAGEVTKERRYSDEGWDDFDEIVHVPKVWDSVEVE